MAQLLINVVFGILNFVSGIFLNPIYNAISSIFPDLASFISSVFTFFGYGFQYFAFILKLFMVPVAPLLIIITMWSGIFAFNLTIRAIGLGMSIYHYFKP